MRHLEAAVETLAALAGVVLAGWAATALADWLAGR